ncbi:hypothetical protein HSB1_08770 [Halogranum salarium B-1]|uniref:Sec-independent protein translocase protein TatA n=1 Tax=Halogranum salarium B-1 TaxID=1210908 RepID=J3JGM9_9EURY|nr:hypothetical protein HSB1_08770 [Halogranum salarium B-1]
MIPLFGPIPGGPELLIILLVLVLLFGANKIPKLARSTGQAMGEFQKGREEVEDELEQMREGKGSRTQTDDEDDEVTPDIGADSTDSTNTATETTGTPTETETEKNN